ncbi:uncharacterized protein LOC110724023 [Chenopodium quinoa]|uniref:uncharacterized protein LOC110724023 n=1 Tax=Chenopodium quinoa TaxID=63459 RepID=UPI000B78505E|nr:uncharacterized protein LOC110724023 [Chenopodium quinoa]
MLSKITVRPYNGGSRVVLRFYLLGFDGKFVNVPQVVCSQNGVSFDRKLGVIVGVSHWMKVMISRSINYLALYSALGGKVWVFGVKLIGDGRSLRLVKCAVIDCRFQISSICLSFGFFILGEMRGVRVFPLRVLVKGKVGSKRRLTVARGKGENSNAEEREVSVKAEGRNSTMPNGDFTDHSGTASTDPLAAAAGSDFLKGYSFFAAATISYVTSLSTNPIPPLDCGSVYKTSSKPSSFQYTLGLYEVTCAFDSCSFNVSVAVYDEYFKQVPHTYSQQMIDELRERWISYVTGYHQPNDDDDDLCEL